MTFLSTYITNKKDAYISCAELHVALDFFFPFPNLGFIRNETCFTQVLKHDIVDFFTAVKGEDSLVWKWFLKQDDFGGIS